MQGSPPEAAELSIPSPFKATSLSRQSTREASAMTGDLINYSKMNLHPDSVRRNLTADLQAVAHPSGDSLSNNVLPIFSKGGAGALPSAAHDDWWALAKPGLNWADDEESLALPQPASQLPPAKPTPAGTDITSSAAAAFAGLTLGHASDKQPSSSLTSNDTAGPSSSSSSFADTASSRPPGVPGLSGLGAIFPHPPLAGAWPSNIEGQRAVNGPSGANPSPPQHIVGMGEAPRLSLEHDSSSGSSSQGFVGSSPARQGPSGTVAPTARCKDGTGCLQLTSTCPQSY